MKNKCEKLQNNCSLTTKTIMFFDFYVFNEIPVGWVFCRGQYHEINFRQKQVCLLQETEDNDGVEIIMS